MIFMYWVCKECGILWSEGCDCPDRLGVLGLNPEVEASPKLKETLERLHKMMARMDEADSN